MNVPDHSAASSLQDKRQLPRRRFIRGVGIAVPVTAIMTVQSPSALAAQCLAPSAVASIALLKSRIDREQLSCFGRTPGFWGNAQKTHPDDLAAAGGDKLFAAVFGSGFDGLTLIQVMGLTGGNPDGSSKESKKNGSTMVDPYQLGAHLSAAYFNLKRGWVPETVLSLQDLIDMWNGRSGAYTPTAGVTWGAEKIVAYLQTTMPL